MGETEPEPAATVIERSLHQPERFAEIFDRHAPHIQRYLARRLARRAADDLVAETFLVAFRKRAGYDPRRRPAVAVRHRHERGTPTPAAKKARLRPSMS